MNCYCCILTCSGVSSNFKSFLHHAANTAAQCTSSSMT